MKELFSITPHSHGKGSVVFSWDPRSKFLASCGQNRRVHIYDRKGDLIFEFALEGDGKCKKLAWDYHGEALAVLQEGSPIVPIWNAGTREMEVLQTNFNDATFMEWSKSAPLLAIGTKKGNLLLYNRDNFMKIPLMGKHTKEITSGRWSRDNKLALTSLDKMVRLWCGQIFVLFILSCGVIDVLKTHTQSTTLYISPSLCLFITLAVLFSWCCSPIFTHTRHHFLTVPLHNPYIRTHTHS